MNIIHIPHIIIIIIYIIIFNLFCTSTESLPSISAENNGLIGKSRGRSLFQNREYEKDNICLTPGCVKAGKHHPFDVRFDLYNKFNKMHILFY